MGGRGDHSATNRGGLPMASLKAAQGPQMVQSTSHRALWPAAAATFAKNLPTCSLPGHGSMRWKSLRCIHFLVLEGLMDWFGQEAGKYQPLVKRTGMKRYNSGRSGAGLQIL